MSAHRREGSPVVTGGVAGVTAAAGIAVVLGLSTGAWLVTTPDQDTALPGGAPGDRAWSAQLHVHGSFSEGQGSIDGHAWQAQDLGVDVIWWSDHDFRITSWRHASTYGFEDWEEPIDRGEPWRAWNEFEDRSVKALRRMNNRSIEGALAGFVDGDAVEGERSLRVRAVGPSAAFEPHLIALRCDRALLQRPLATRVTLRVSVFPEQLGEDARGVLRIKLSEHPPREGLRFRPYMIQYVLTNETDATWREEEMLSVPLPYELGRWNHYELPVTSDVVAGLPFAPGEDNSLQQMMFGVEVRRGATASLRFDDLRIEQELSGTPVFARQGALIDEVGELYPDVVQHQGVELSFGAHHLNDFSVATRLVDADEVLEGSDFLSGDPPRLDQDRFQERVSRVSVERVHARGGLVSFNHIFGTADAGAEAKLTAGDALEEMVANRLWGADLLEVGYPDRGGHLLADHLWVWDSLAARGLRIVGLGVSDSHGGEEGRWRTDVNNFISWIWAPSPSKPELIEGMRAGRLFFGDVVVFDGTVDLTTARGFRMGQEVLTDRTGADVTVHLRGLRAGDEIRIVSAGSVAATHRATDPDQDFPYRLDIPEGADRFVRAEVYAADGAPKVFSNPIWFVREVPEQGLGAPRAAIDVAGVRVLDTSAFDVTAVRLDPSASGRALRIEGNGDGGSLLVAGLPGAEGVELEGITGRVRVEGDEVSLDELSGSGSIVLPFPR